MPGNDTTTARWADARTQAPATDTAHLIPVVPGKQGVDEMMRRVGILGGKAADVAQGTPHQVAKLGKKAAQAATLENLEAAGVAIAHDVAELEQFVKQARRKVMNWPDDVAAEMKQAKRDIQAFIKEAKTKKPKPDEPSSDVDLRYQAQLAWLAVKQTFQPEPEYRRIQVKPYIAGSEARVEADQTIARLFAGCRLEWTSLGKLKAATDLASGGKDTYTAGKSLYKARKDLAEAAGTLKKVAEEAKAGDASVFAHLGEILEVDPGIARDFALDIGLNAPLLRPLVAGVKAAAQATLGGLTVRTYRAAGAIGAAHPSEEWIQLSLRALQDILMQKIVRHSVLLGTYTYDAITGVLDPTSVSATVSIGVRTGYMLHTKFQLYLLRRDTNKVLGGGGTIDLRTVHACPLLGCYLLYMLDPDVIKGYFHDYDPAKATAEEAARYKAEQMAKYGEKDVENDDRELATLTQLAWKRLRASPLTLFDARGVEVVPFSKSNKIVGLYL